MSSVSSYWSSLLILLIPFPIGTDRKRQRFPWVTTTLIVLNVIVFGGTQFYLQTHPTFGADNFYAEYGFLPDAPHLTNLLMSLFIHVSVGHIFWNMAFLWLFGSHVEDALGSLSFTALYFGGGLSAGLLYTAVKWLIPGQHISLEDPLVGASGAISAVIAPFALRYHRAQIRLIWLPALVARSSWSQMEVPAIAGLALWLAETLAGAAVSVIEPASGGVAYWAHLGGFVFGLVASEMGGLLREGRQEYLLQEARHAMKSHAEPTAQTIGKYRLLLERNPRDTNLQIEMMRALLRLSPAEANKEMGKVIQSALQAQRWSDALRLWTEAELLQIPVFLTARDRLRLAATAEEIGNSETAAMVLKELLEETPEAPEAEIACLRLGQILLKSRPLEGRQVLRDFLVKYPASHWATRADELLGRRE